MKYINAADVLPMELLKELSAYVNGQLLYVPSMESKRLLMKSANVSTYPMIPFAK